MTATVELAPTQDNDLSNAAIPKRVQHWLTSPAQFSLVSGSKERCLLQGYIAKRFRQEYNADITEFMPHLVQMICCGKISAAVGFRCASAERLFVEQYLPAPIENSLPLREGSPTRARIVELGNLVASHRGASRLLFLTLANCLRLAGVEWIVFTATRQVAKIVAKFSCETADLGPANPACLGDNAHKWGSYYHTKPRVVAMHLPTARRQIETSAMAKAVLHLYKTENELLAESFSRAMLMTDI